MYKHIWMIRLADWLYNKYMKINREVIKKNTLVYFPETKTLIDLANNHPKG